MCIAFLISPALSGFLERDHREHPLCGDHAPPILRGDIGSSDKNLTGRPNAYGNSNDNHGQACCNDFFMSFWHVAGDGPAGRAGGQRMRAFLFFLFQELFLNRRIEKKE